MVMANRIYGVLKLRIEQHFRGAFKDRKVLAEKKQFTQQPAKPARPLLLYRNPVVFWRTNGVLSPCLRG